jgi:large repetitive protein
MGRLRLALIAAAGLLAFGGPVPDASATETGGASGVTASCEGPREASASGPGTYRFKQTFSPKVSGALTRAQVDVTKAPGSSGDWVLQVILNSPIPVTTPTHAVIATTTVPDSSVPNGESTITGEFSDPPMILTGGLPRRVYELVVTRPASADVTVGYRQGNDCAGGLLLSGAQTGPFYPFEGETNDMVFKAFVSDLAPPQTRIVKGPRKRTAKRRARFRLRASEAVEKFECRIDARPFERCDRRERAKVGRGRHRFRARAVDLAGNVDPTPAKLKWKVVE